MHARGEAMGDAKTATLHFAAPEERVRTVLDRMKRHGIRHLPVVEGDRLAGILSDRDLLLHAWSGQMHSFPDDLTVRDIMTKDVVTARYGTPLADVARMMISRKVDSIPLLGPEGNVMAIVTSTDLIRLVSERHEELQRVEHSREFLEQFRWDMPEII